MKVILITHYVASAYFLFLSYYRASLLYTADLFTLLCGRRYLTFRVMSLYDECIKLQYRFYTSQKAFLKHYVYFYLRENSKQSLFCELHANALKILILAHFFCEINT